MEQYEKSIIPFIESIYSTFTPMEKVVADFFIQNMEKTELSAKDVSRHLFVSEASLSRFAQKCGYKGYREFLFHYKESFNKEEVVTDDNSKRVLNTYQELLNKSYSLVNESQMNRIVKLFQEKKRVYVYGRGSSGLVGSEMKLRFMRIGVNMESIVDSHIMRMNSVILDDSCVVIGISVSGTTPEVIDSLKSAKEKGAVTILMTCRHSKEFEECFDEVMLLAVKEHLDNGMAISPQFPILVMVDILYSHFLESDKFHMEALHDYTMDALSKQKPALL